MARKKAVLIIDAIDENGYGLITHFDRQGYGFGSLSILLTKQL